MLHQIPNWMAIQSNEPDVQLKLSSNKKPFFMEGTEQNYK